jgi:outer membrane protein OmpA-like peptidoglycan-associated protein
MSTRCRWAIVCLLGILLSLSPSAPLLAQEETAPSTDFGFLLGGAFPDEALVGSGEDRQFNFLFGARLGHLFTERVGIYADACFVGFDGETSIGDVDEYGVQLGPEFILNPDSRFRWFLSAGGGRAWYKPELGPENFDRWRYSVGFGQRVAASDTARVRWEIRGLRTVGDDGLGGEDITNLQALFGVSWGTAATPVDTDGDGVRDRKDACPDTPRGATVDEKGCPKDSDGDGVFDGLDRCPDTPQGVKVDPSGCPMDSDGDGVSDGPDACPDTPRGAAVDEKGCPKDSDGDGVWDGLDRCPDTPRGTKVDRNGCPLDSDGDGVADDKDRCPDTPRGTSVDAEGCPPPPPPEPRETAPLPERGKALVLQGVNFETDSATLTAESTGILDRVAESLIANPDVKVEVGGHTDSRGSDAHNLSLSRRRAKSVQDYLVSKGVAASQTTSAGYGEKQPIASNDTEEGRLQNRRVELKRID